jgi:hypothetical protein
VHDKTTGWGRDEFSKCFAIREEVGGRDCDRTGDPLLAKTRKKIYLIGRLALFCVAMLGFVHNSAAGGPQVIKYVASSKTVFGRRRVACIEARMDDTWD